MEKEDEQCKNEGCDRPAIRQDTAGSWWCEECWEKAFLT